MGWDRVEWIGSDRIRSNRIESNRIDQSVSYINLGFIKGFFKDCVVHM